jgi:hypothetical protein
MRTKDEQDVRLQSLMELESVERKRQRPDFDKKKPKAFSVKYQFAYNGIRTDVNKLFIHL